MLRKSFADFQGQISPHDALSVINSQVIHLARCELSLAEGHLRPYGVRGIFWGATMSRTVLIVDVNAGCRSVIAQKLRSNGFKVAEADNLGDAMTVIKNGKINLAVIDGQFPERGAVRFIGTLRAENYNLPIIFVSDQLWRNPTKLGELTDRLHISQVLRKPVDVDLLQIQVEDLLGHRETTSEHAVVVVESPESVAKRNRLETNAKTELVALRDGFRGEAVAGFEKLGQVLSHSVNKPPREHRTLLLGAHLLATRLRGSAGTLGFLDESRLAAEVEEQIASVLGTEGITMPTGKILQAVAMTRKAVKSLKGIESDSSPGNRVADTILLIEPDGERAEAIQSALRDGGLEPHLSTEGMGILREITKLQPKAVVTRLFMSKIDGFSIAKHIRDKWPHDIPLIGLTDRTGADVRMASYRAGFDDCILLPVAAEELLIRITPRIHRFRHAAA